MKQNVKIVSTYLIGFIGLNLIMILLIAGIPGLLDDQELFTQYSIYANVSFYFITAAVLIIMFRTYLKEQIKDYISRIKFMGLVVAGGVVSIYIAAMIAGIVLTLLGVEQEAANQQGILDMIEASSTIQLILIITFITVLAPIVEELVFRKGVYGLVGKFTMNLLAKPDNEENKKQAHLIANIVAIVVSSFVFGAIHATDAYILLYAGLGMVLGTVYFISNKNIIAPMVVHVLYNTVSIVLTLFVFN